MLCVNTEKDTTYVQCTNCGHVHIVERKIPMERSIVNSYCEKCGHRRALNCGYSEMDLIELRDPYLDERYFIY